MSRYGWLSAAAHGRPRRARCSREFDVRGGEPETLRRRRCRAATSRRSCIAREIACDPQVLIAAQPTRGLDVGAIEFVHRRLVAERDAGRADPARVARVRGGPLARRPHPRHLRGRDRRRVPARRHRGGARHRDDRRRARERRPPRERQEPASRDEAEAARRRGRPEAAATTSAGAAGDLPARRRRHRPAAHGLARLLRRRPRRAHHRPQPDHDLQGDLRRHRAELAVPVGRAAPTARSPR